MTPSPLRHPLIKRCSNELKITSIRTLNYENANAQMWNKCNFNVIWIVFNLPLCQLSFALVPRFDCKCEFERLTALIRNIIYKLCVLRATWPVMEKWKTTAERRGSIFAPSPTSSYGIKTPNQTDKTSNFVARHSPHLIHSLIKENNFGLNLFWCDDDCGKWKIFTTFCHFVGFFHPLRALCTAHSELCATVSRGNSAQRQWTHFYGIQFHSYLFYKI